ncbi:MAG: hypothetical protein HYX59_04460 [Elusimicrobia bacterium]|nr:hypothetical protein [Elusimicrobiota bacterium]
MAPIAFTKNHTDHSGAQGYQFEFHCDKCGKGVRSSVVTSAMDLASGLLGAVSGLFGGQASGAGLKDTLRRQNWEHAFDTAANEVRPRFSQCPRCGNWVCPSSCWNAKASQCKGCAPDSAA